MNINKSLYDDMKSEYAEESIIDPSGVLIEIDLSGPKKSLMELINLVRQSIEGKPDDLRMTIYFVSGSELTQNDWSSLIDYLISLPNPKHIVYRGFIHPETLRVLTNFNTLTIDKDVKLLYIADKVPVIMKSLLNRPDIFRKFMERWIEHYKNIDRGLLDLTELQVLGFEFNIIGQ